MPDSAPPITSADCSNCGAPQLFDPGTQGLACRYCGHTEAIPVEEFRVVELDYGSYLGRLAASQEEDEVHCAQCPGCGAQVTLGEDIASDPCPYCGVQVALEPCKRKLIRPGYILPFRVSAKQAKALLGKWAAGLWFAPRDFKKEAASSKRLQGVYVPYWTYDAAASTSYTGERGEYYWETEHYTTFENGKSVRKTRQVRKTRWYRVSGVVHNSFDDVLVCASRTSPADRFCGGDGSWDIENLLPVDDDYVRGFRVESYQKSLAQGFEEAEGIMEPRIRTTIRRDIGGDEQHIGSMAVRYRDITFKHILVPIWVSAHTHRERIYRFVINARTGRVSGSRPWSIGWIIFAVLAVASLIALAALVIPAVAR